ncbi:MAG: hypothetical protein ACOX8U_09900 [Bradymonadia bacterium]|jgi:hypothetical protein
MSKTRQHDIKQDTAGVLVRRWTLAGLGLDAMQGVSASSRAMLEGADSFAERLMGGMLKSGVARAGLGSFEAKIGQASVLSPASTRTAGIARSATDVGEWRYWLDAVLLMLFNDEEDEARLGVSASAVKAQVSSLQREGLSAKKLTQLAAKQRENLFAQHKLASKVGEQLELVTKLGTSPLSFTSDSMRREDLLLSKVSGMALEASDAVSAKSVARWTKALTRLRMDRGRDERLDRALLREVNESVRSLAKDGVLGAESIQLIERFEKNYFENMLRSDDRFLGQIKDISEGGSSLTSLRMLEPRAKHGGAMNDAIRRRMSAISSVVQGYVEQHGSDELSSSWLKAADRFERLSGFSMDVDRVLLRELSQAEDALVASSVIDLDSLKSAMMVSTRRDAYAVEQQQRLSASLLNRVELASRDIHRKLSESASSLQSVEFARFEQSLRQLSQRKGMSAAEDQLLLAELTHDLELLSQSESLRQGQELAIASTQAFYDRIAAYAGEDATLTQLGDSLSRIVDARGITMQERVRMLSELSERLQSFSAERVAYSQFDFEGVQLRADLAQSVDASQHETLKSLLVDAVSQVEAAKRVAGANKIELALNTSQAFYDRIASYAGEDARLTQLGDSLSQIGGARAVTMQERVGMLSELSNRLQGFSAERVGYSQFDFEGVQLRADLAQSVDASQHEALKSLLSDAVSQVEAAKRVALARSARPELAEASSAYEAARYSELMARQASAYESFVDGLRLAQSAITSGHAHSLALAGQKLDSGMTSLRSVVIGEDKIDTQYLQSIGSSISVLAKLMDSNERSERALDLQSPIERRMGQMFSLLNLGEDEDKVQERMSSEFGERHLEMRELTPLSESLIQLKHELARDKSQQSLDLSSMLGADKAVVRHLSSMLSGESGDSTRSLQSALAKRYVEQLEKTTAVSSAASALHSAGLLSLEHSGNYSNLGESLDTVKLSLSLSPKSDTSVGLKQNIEFSHMPQALRGAEETRSFTARLELEPSIAHNLVAENFVPVNLGMGIAGDYDVVSDDLAYSQERYAQRDSSRFAGIDLDFGPEAYVRMVAQPEFKAAAHTQATDLYREHAARESSKAAIGSLRKSYVEQMAQKQKQSERYGKLSDSFSSANFANVLRNISVAHSVRGGAEDGLLLKSALETTKREEVELAPSYPGVLGNAMSFFVPLSAETPSVKQELSKYLEASNAGYASFDSSKAMNEVLAISEESGGQYASNAHHASLALQEKQNAEILSRIDSLLDYAVGKSSSQVGVFSSNETVRVLLDALPESAYLGEKGLPSWRVKNHEAIERANQRELREALRKIGATPIQGVQAHHDKSFVNPFATKEADSAQQMADPLFSGGDIGGSSPSSLLTSAMGDLKNITDALPSPHFLRMLAEEVYKRILENLSEELQRRRTE